MTDTKLFYALESLPDLLGKGELRVLKQAMMNTIGIDHASQLQSESDGEYLARLIRTAARVRFERTEPRPLERELSLIGGL